MQVEMIRINSIKIPKFLEYYAHTIPVFCTFLIGFYDIGSPDLKKCLEMEGLDMIDMI